MKFSHLLKVLSSFFWAIALVTWGGESVVSANNRVCIVNKYEVPWVHPGLTLFLNNSGNSCFGDGIVLQKGESGCFKNDKVPIDGSWHLSGLDATTAECITICAITATYIEIRYGSSGALSCVQ